jgi:hypothetical protein
VVEEIEMDMETRFGGEILELLCEAEGIGIINPLSRSNRSAASRLMSRQYRVDG